MIHTQRENIRLMQFFQRNNYRLPSETELGGSEEELAIVLALTSRFGLFNGPFHHKLNPQV
jgi:hypothetical protein